MNLQALPGVGLVAVFVAGGVLYLLALLWVISRFSGWARLGQRFGTTEEFRGEAWNWQSARFRGWCSYNNCLKVGASPEGLSFAVMRVMFPLRCFHPSLLIPWREIEVETGKAFFGFYDMARFRIGTEEQITVAIYGKLVTRVREAAGVGWPLYNIEQMEARRQ